MPCILCMDFVGSINFDIFPYKNWRYFTINNTNRFNGQIGINFLRPQDDCYFVMVLFLGKLKIGTSYPSRDTELITTTCKKYHEHYIFRQSARQREILD